jgi:hypothetical protein
MDTGLEFTDGHVIKFVLSAVKHLFIKVLAVDPLQWDSFRGRNFRCTEVTAALDLKLEAIPHVASSVDLDPVLLSVCERTQYAQWSMKGWPL